MENSIKIGPIRKARPTLVRSTIIQDRITKMKVGNFFEISGIISTAEARNMRALLQYHSKKENVKVTTALTGSILRVERIKSSKTKESTRV
ncbi:hypothetical protein UFOVP1247_333 [uncultured Caudovirales phage]|jgi:tartrate dehydratase beta subunit/fumarate hydratase class I family protein|uniref:Uncharacterized protein n=1 Tax=uncultured Caudovirales phage TaxID=2100421 RepID=A0A6J5PYA0_9CAUD|nr:hypothetical protein UFOVP970_20 [uncultured Caudovirales phage]CAB4193962.1 hypothetical protein UFOVP1247_333 [uncultured Caudovirales phage]